MTTLQFLVLASLVILVFSFWMATRYYPVRFHPRSLTLMGLMVALGTVAGPLMIPVGPAHAYPIQHTINVVAGVLLGPVEAVLIALLVGILRNVLGLGTLLALPGGVIGAFLAGVIYRRFQRIPWAAAGEVVGTGLFGALAAVPIVRLIMGQELAALGLVIPFTLSALVGAVAAQIILRGVAHWFQS